MPCQIQSHHMLNHRLAITNAFCVLILVSVLLAGQGATPARAVGTTLFVVPTKDAHECTSWADACDLQYALGKAASGDSVWVAQGTYQPTPGTDRAVSFQLETGVQIYGGFVGTETLLGQRNPTTHVTTLSGDIGTVGDSSDNSYHVVYASGVTSAGVLDGFTITGGHGTGGSYSLGAGAGMLTVSSSPTLQNLIVSGNYSTGTGGGMFNNGGAPSLTNVTFLDNEAANQGGGMYNAAGGHPVLTNASFQGNSALAGGGLYTSADLTIEHSEFDGNEAGAGGGGGIFNLGGAVTLTDVALDDNTSEGSGGAIESETGATTTRTSPFGKSQTPQIRGLRQPALRTHGVQNMPWLPGSCGNETTVNSDCGLTVATTLRIAR